MVTLRSALLSSLLVQGGKEQFPKMGVGGQKTTRVLAELHTLYQPLKAIQGEKNLYLFGLSLKSVLLSSWEPKEEIEMDLVIHGLMSPPEKRFHLEPVTCVFIPRKAFNHPGLTPPWALQPRCCSAVQAWHIFNQGFFFKVCQRASSRFRCTICFYCCNRSPQNVVT